MSGSRKLAGEKKSGLHATFNNWVVWRDKCKWHLPEPTVSSGHLVLFLNPFLSRFATLTESGVSWLVTLSVCR